MKLYLCILLCIKLKFISSSESTLKFIAAIHRHGDETPKFKDKLYPNDPYRNIDYWPEGFGQLTNEGKDNMFKMGQYLQSKYADFLTKSPRDVDVLSSELDRCLESVQLLLAGMFPPEGEWVWNKELKWQPFPVQIDIKMLNHQVKCKEADRRRKRIEKEIATNLLVNNTKLFEDLTNYTGAVINGNNVANLNNILFVEKIRKLKLPVWADDEMLDTIEKLTEEIDSATFSDSIIRKLMIGLFFADMRLKVNATFDGNSTHLRPEKKISIYSTRATELSALTCELLGETIYTPYAGTYVFEYHEDDEDAFVKVILYFIEDTEFKAKDIKIVGCDDKCSLDQFYKITKKIIPNDWDAECNPKSDDNLSPDNDGNYATLLSPTTSLIFLFSALKFLFVLP